MRSLRSRSIEPPSRRVGLVMPLVACATLHFTRELIALTASSFSASFCSASPCAVPASASNIWLVQQLFSRMRLHTASRTALSSAVGAAACTCIWCFAQISSQLWPVLLHVPRSCTQCAGALAHMEAALCRPSVLAARFLLTASSFNSAERFAALPHHHE
jgi:hypothetical protein